MMTRRLLVSCAWSAALLVPALPHAVTAQEPYPGFDAYVSKSLQALRVPGASVAIVRNDSVIYRKGFGVLANGSRTPVNEQTLFEIGSSSEAATRANAQRRPDTTSARKPASPPLPAYVGTFTDSLYGEATASLQNGRLEFTRGPAGGLLEYWNANTFLWRSNGSIPATTQYIRFEVAPDDKVTGLWFGLPPDVSVLGRALPPGARR